MRGVRVFQISAEAWSCFCSLPDASFTGVAHKLVFATAYEKPFSEED
jgi:hypothetical protein